ncbi:hypothetical protein ASA1KI_41570 [Opitutales bacterium ASA1]|uniref:3-keto-disaccharide hydrolase n=1 Tax=Congregicoccus parvus TaxID=3081749 RepID=UPI002B290FA0|nr:hypothetical protein ASA1KI_41570 [Opitutales bacterium ASA1]
MKVSPARRAVGRLALAGFWLATSVLDAAEPGFVSLFNGRDLAGWRGALESYEVVEGTLVCREGATGVIYTEEVFEDFVVRLEFRLSPAGNNGLALRYPGEGDPAYSGMTEIQILGDDYEQVTGNRIDPRQAHGSAYGMIAAKRGHQRPVGQWNSQEVTVLGSTIRVVLNGVVILDGDLAEVTSFLADRAHPGKDRTSGAFGLAGHRDPVAFRDIRIKRLPSAAEGAAPAVGTRAGNAN